MCCKWVSRVFAMIVACVFLTPTFAWGWGKEGHIIVARIAELRLSDDARAGISELIDVPLSDDKIANWPDHIRNMPSFTRIYPHNAGWHFVDIPFDKNDYDPEREAAAGDGKGNNIIDQIERWRKVLANHDARLMERRDALRFLVHFLGDIHQPLHCIDKNDRGGNSVKVHFLKIRDNHLNLHHVWDTNLVLENMRNSQPLDYARKINGKITDSQRAKWEAITKIEDWALESHKIGQQIGYPKGEPDTRGFFDLDAAFVAAGKQAVEKQLQKAGVRLARVLNDAFAAPDDTEESIQRFLVTSR